MKSGKKSEQLDTHLPEIKSFYLYSVTRGLIPPPIESGMKILQTQVGMGPALYPHMLTIA